MAGIYEEDISVSLEEVVIFDVGGDESVGGAFFRAVQEEEAGASAHCHPLDFLT